jgi:serine/threonine-protein kinase
MNPCPSEEGLRQLLAEELPPAQAATAVEHVGACAWCQARLERLSDDAQLRAWVPDRLSESAAGPALAALLRELGARPTSGTSGTAVTDPRAPAGSLAFLGPPQRPGDLGTLGPYPVEEELGQGGMGIVLRGRDEALGRTVALKVLRPELAGARARARFVREARAAARVEHDHIVRVHAVHDAADGPPYLVMEFLPGKSLAGLLRASKCLAPAAAAELAAQVADGLAAAHAAGLVHRDIKPANIMLDALGRARITDFGLVKELVDEPQAEERLTQTGAILGTPGYMAPEQAEGSVGPAADLWALGAVLYEMLTGRPPFLAGNVMDTLLLARTQDPVPPRRLQPGLPRDLETICLKALAREPRRRYASARDLADDLRRWQAGKAILARPVGAAESAWRWCRRNPGMAGLLAALAGVLAAGFVAVLGEWRRAEDNAGALGRERDLAAASAAQAKASSQQALEVVKTFVTRVYNENFLSRPEDRAKRQILLADALRYYRAFLRQRGDDPALRRELAEIHFQVGQIVADTGDKRKAVKSFQKSLALYQELAGAKVDADLRRQIGLCHHYLAENYQVLGRVEKCLRSRRHSLEELEQLVRANPKDRAQLCRLATGHGSLANTYLGLKRNADARRHYQRALRHFERLVKAEPKNHTFRHCLATTWFNLS